MWEAVQESAWVTAWESAWEKATATLVSAPGVVLLVGAADTGKSTLAGLLVNAYLQAGRRVAVVDADIGQSDVGPPGTVGLGYPRGPIQTLGEVEATGLGFVGATSPVRVLAEHVIATFLMVQRARREGAEAIIVDTTGLAEGFWGQTLKELKIEALSPRWLVLLERGDELLRIRRGLRGRVLPQVLRLPPSGRVKVRSREERKQVREARLGRYLSRAAPLRLRADKIGWVRARWTQDAPAMDLRHLWVGLADRTGQVLAAGTVLEADRDAHSLVVLTPWSRPEDVCSVILGSMRVSPDGRELPWAPSNVAPAPSDTHG